MAAAHLSAPRTRAASPGDTRPDALAIPPPRNLDATTEPETPEAEIPHVEISLNEGQLGRIWESLTLESKAYAIASALEQLIS